MGMDFSEVKDYSMTKSLIKVAIGIPNKGITDALCYDNHLEFMHRLGKTQSESITNGKLNEIQFLLITISRVFPALARERISEFSIDEGKADYLLMWDDDMLLPMDMFDRLYAHNVDIVAALAFTRLAPHKPVIYNLTEGYDAVEKKSYYINHVVTNYPKNTLVECDAVGFGAVLIKTKVLKSMTKPWFMSTTGSGEDIYFCHQARKQGFRVFVDTSVKLGHLTSPMIVTEETYESDENIKILRKTREDEIKYPETKR